MRTSLGFCLALLLLAACGEPAMNDTAATPRSGSPNFAVGQPANAGAAVQPSTRGGRN